MRKLPKDFTAGLGKYKQNDVDGKGSTAVNNGASAGPKVASPPTILNLPGSSSHLPADGHERAPTQDLDTINL